MSGNIENVCRNLYKVRTLGVGHCNIVNTHSSDCFEKRMLITWLGNLRHHCLATILWRILPPSKLCSTSGWPPWLQQSVENGVSHIRHRHRRRILFCRQISRWRCKSLNKLKKAVRTFAQISRYLTFSHPFFASSG